MFFHAPHKSCRGGLKSWLFPSVALSDLLPLDLFKLQRIERLRLCLCWECRVAVKAGMHSLYELYINSSVFPMSVITNSIVEKSTEGIAFFLYIHQACLLTPFCV